MANHIKDDLDIRDSYEEHSSDRASKGSVNYLDGSVLQRPLTLPMKMWPILLAIALVALFIGYQVAHRIDHNVVHHSERVAESVQAQIDRGISQDVPMLSSLAGMEDETIIQTFVDAGYGYVDMNEINGVGEASIDIIKLPSDMSVEDAALAYTSGVSSLDSETAAKFLSGSWRFMVVRETGYSYSVKYADFNSPDSAAAVQAAIEAQGFADSTMGDSGVDGSGNTFQDGSIDIDGTTYYWSVSACDLSEVYSVNGLPENAQYVGVRFTT